MRSIIISIPNQVGKKLSGHFRGRMEIIAKTLEEINQEDVIIPSSEDMVEAIKDPSTRFTYIHLGDSYGGEVKGYTWNEYGRESKDPEMYQSWLNEQFRIWGSINSARNPIALEFPFPRNFKSQCGWTFKWDRWANTPLKAEFDSAMDKIKAYRIYDPEDPEGPKKFCDVWFESIDNTAWSGFVLGDSHGLSTWRPGYALLYRKGETLHGAIKRGFDNILKERFPGLTSTLRKGIFNYGNIDIRHHICRMPDHQKAVEKLVDGYVEQLHSLRLDEVTIVQPYPINDDVRVISQSVMYRPKIILPNGKEKAGNFQPFSGSWSDRDKACRYMSDLLELACNQNNWKFHKWPAQFKDSKGRFNPEVMEGGRPGAINGRGIHLSPEFYYWDLKANRPNEYSQFDVQAVDDFFL